MGNGKGGCMLPMPPMMFPHPAQLQAMGAAAQAAMAQAAKQPGGMPACFPMGMFPPMPMMQQQQQPDGATPACMQQQQQQQSCKPSSHPATPAAEPAAAADADDEDDTVPDEDVEVEPELEQIFEKVAAMERAHKAAMVAVQVRSMRLNHAVIVSCSLGSAITRQHDAVVSCMELQGALWCVGGSSCACRMRSGDLRWLAIKCQWHIAKCISIHYAGH
jgi:type IV secretory pathway VirB10-like protein